MGKKYTVMSQTVSASANHSYVKLCNRHVMGHKRSVPSCVSEASVDDLLLLFLLLAGFAAGSAAGFAGFADSTRTQSNLNRRDYKAIMSALKAAAQVLTLSRNTLRIFVNNFVANSI